MKKLSLLPGLLLALSLIAASPKLHAVQFARLSLAEAKLRAAQLQRPLFVHFAANWCLPCQWLEKNTFTDPEVRAYLNERYLAVQIDVDEVQGYADKESCGIKYLPSMLIFNAGGIVVARYEETLDAQQMLTVLHKFDTPANCIPAKNTSTIPAVRVNAPVASSVPTVVDIENSLSAAVEDDPADLDAQRRPITQTSIPIAVPKMGVQLGVYSNYENVIRQVQYFEKKFYKTVHISSASTNGQTYYHLIAGPFKQAGEMQNYLNLLQREGIKGLIVTL